MDFAMILMIQENVVAVVDFIIRLSETQFVIVLLDNILSLQTKIVAYHCSPKVRVNALL